MDTIYLDDIAGTIGVWLDADIAPDVPLEVITLLEKAYNICVKEID